METDNLWSALSSGLRNWTLSRVPPDVTDRHHQTCARGKPGEVFVVQTVCEFDLGGWTTDGLRAELQTPEVQHRIRLNEYRFRVGGSIALQIWDAAGKLEEVLERTLAEY